MTQYDGAWLDKMYNNRALVPDFPLYMQRWAEQSSRVRQSEPSHLDLAYGDGLNETLDVFPAKGGADKAPVIVFIHGGFWRALDKSDHSFVAPAFTAAGACVVVPNYALCPAVTIPQITMQMVKALAWVWRNIAKYGGDPSRITVIGHSAGGHLAAMMLACQWKSCSKDLPTDLVKNVVAVSGLFELESMSQTPFLKDALQLTPADILKASPAWIPPPRSGQFVAFAGGDESEGFHQQVALINRAWKKRTPVALNASCAGLNHLSIMDACTTASHPLNRFIVDGVMR